MLKEVQDALGLTPRLKIGQAGIYTCGTSGSPVPHVTVVPVVPHATVNP